MTDGPAGYERASLSTARQKTNGSDGTYVRVLTVDDFLEQAGLSRSPIYHMVIDTEGHDALVLEGLKRTLSRRGVALLEFEVSWMDWWWSTAHHRRYKRTPRAEWRKFGSAL